MTIPRTDNREDRPSLDEAVRARLDAGDPGGAVEILVKRLGPNIRAYLRTLLREDEADEARKFVEDCMRIRPKWALGLPLNCESKMGVSYGG